MLVCGVIEVGCGENEFGCGVIEVGRVEIDVGSEDKARMIDDFLVLWVGCQVMMKKTVVDCLILSIRETADIKLWWMIESGYLEALMFEIQEMIAILVIQGLHSQVSYVQSGT